MSKSENLVCPRCNGNRGRTVHLYYGPGKGGEWKTIACELCNGTGHATPEARDRFEAGRQMWRDRRARKVSIADEAQRLGITEGELYRREWGEN